MNKHKHDIDFTMTNGVEAEAYIPPYLFFQENTVQVQGAGANCSGQPHYQYKLHKLFDIFQYLCRTDFVHIDYYFHFMLYEHLTNNNGTHEIKM